MWNIHETAILSVASLLNPPIPTHRCCYRKLINAFEKLRTPRLSCRVYCMWPILVLCLGSLPLPSFITQKNTDLFSLWVSCLSRRSFCFALAVAVNCFDLDLKRIRASDLNKALQESGKSCSMLCLSVSVCSRPSLPRVPQWAASSWQGMELQVWPALALECDHFLEQI